MLRDALLVVLAVFAALSYRELVKIRQQVSSTRQFLEWFSVGYLENRENVSPQMQQYIEKTKDDLIKEGLYEGTITQEVADEVRNRKR